MSFALKQPQKPHIESETASLSMFGKRHKSLRMTLINQRLEIKKAMPRKYAITETDHNVSPNPLVERGTKQIKSAYDVN